MGDTGLKTSHGIIVTPGGSQFCEAHRPIRTDPIYGVSISTIRSKEDGWIAKGEGHILQGRCPRPGCSVMFQSVLRAIPIQFALFPCPTCKESQTFEPRIHSIEATNESFQFEVSIICKKCGKKKSLKKILEKILEVVKIEVKPTGITIKNA